MLAEVLLAHLEASGATAETVVKPWGREITVVTSDLCFKVITVEEGERTSLQKHVKKDELILPYDGFGNIEVHVGWDDRGPGIMRYGIGSAVRLRPGQVHRANGPLTFLEVSTPHLDDVIRLEDDYASAR